MWHLYLVMFHVSMGAKENTSKQPLPPPDDMVHGHKEYVIFNYPIRAIKGEKERVLLSS